MWMPKRFKNGEQRGDGGNQKMGTYKHFPNLNSLKFTS